MADEMKEIEKLLESHPSLKITKNKEDKMRVVCELMSHEIPCNMKSVKAYIAGKRYKLETANQLTFDEQELCKQHLVLKRRGQLFCKLTKRHINNLPHHIKLHLKGRRFQNAIRKAQQQNLMEESLQTNETRPPHEDKSMWVPSDSECESEGNDGLGSDFEMKKKEESVTAEDGYSFDVLDDKSDGKDVEELTSKSKSKQKSKRKHESESTKKKDMKKLSKSEVRQGKKRKHAL